MTRESNRAAVLRFYEHVLAHGLFDELHTLATEDYDEHVPMPGQAAGRTGLEQRVRAVRAALRPRHTLHDVVAEDDLVAVRWTLNGVHARRFMGVPATGRPIELSGIDIFRMSGGRLSAHWSVVDLSVLYARTNPTRAYEEGGRNV